MMKAMTPQINHIDREAAGWLTKVEAGGLSATEQAALDAWLAADTRHFGAYLKAKAVLAHAERFKKLPQNIQAGQDVSTQSRRRVIMAGSIAASLVALAVGGSFLWSSLREDVYATKLGEIRRIALVDGSVITLNTQSKAIVRYSPATRAVTLVQGEALFDVAKNKARAFVVEVNGIKVRAVGTSFSVRALVDRPLEVLVREGVVKMDLAREKAVFLSANSRAVMSPDGAIAVEVLTPVKVAGDLAWKSGHIILQHRTLNFAAKEFSRYSKTMIVIEEPSVGDLTVTGIFASDDPVAFARAVALSLKLNVEVGDHEVRLTRRKINSAP